MNMKNMMKQVQKLQNDMMKEKQKIDETIFKSKLNEVQVEMSGDKTVKKVSINLDNIEKDDIEMLEDMFLVAINDVLNQIDEETEKKLGKFTSGMPGIF